MDEPPTISTHVLDTELGRPAPGIQVDLALIHEDGFEEPVHGTTDEDGRIRRLTNGPLRAGTYLLTFYLERPFFRQVSLTFVVDDTSHSYHVPLLIAPYALSTYRGS